jgi:hypothetical protein
MKAKKVTAPIVRQGWFAPSLQIIRMCDMVRPVATGRFALEGNAPS